MSLTDIVDFINFINWQELLHTIWCKYELLPASHQCHAPPPSQVMATCQSEVMMMRVTSLSHWNRQRWIYSTWTFFSPKKLNVVDAFKKFDASEEEKNNMLGYITRAKMNDKAFSSLGGYYVVPDEENKKLIITEAIGEGEKKLFICHCCTDLT